MNYTEWLTLAQASEKLGKNYRYLTNLKNRNPEYFKGIQLKKIGGSNLIKASDIDTVLERVKKPGDHLKTRVFKWSTKTNSHFVF